MKLGIDFGSRWIVVAIADRGNYPVVTFESEQAGARKYFPPLVAVQGIKRIYGWDAWSAQSDPNAILFEAPGPLKPFDTTAPEPEGADAGMLDVLTEIASAIHTALESDANLNRAEAEPYEVMLGIPVQADRVQRWATAEAFRRAGFIVMDVIEEPFADSLEYRHLHPQSGCVLACHIGARISAACIVNIDSTPPVTLDTTALESVSTDHFDAMLAELAWESADLPPSTLASLGRAELFALYEECRHERESLMPSAQRCVIDLADVLQGGQLVSVLLGAFHERCRPKVDNAIQEIEHLIAIHKALSVPIYVTGEGSEFPFVIRRLREVFGNQVCRAANGRATTAVGLAIAAEQMQHRRLLPVESFPHSPLDPEHWLAEFIERVVSEYHASGGTITFDVVAELLTLHRREFAADMQTARRMLRAYPHLFEKT